MKKIKITYCLLAGFAIGLPAGLTQTTFINEINYLASNPSSRGIEIAGESGTNMAGWSAVFYKPDGTVESSRSMNSGQVPNQQNGHGTIWYEVEQLNSGQTNRGGAALVRPDGSVEQFSSYGTDASGQPVTISAVEGPANGMTSQYIGKQTNPNKSLQLKGIGIELLDFIWGLPIFNNTPGQVNTLQIFGLIGGLLREEDVQNSAQIQALWPADPGAEEIRTYPNPVNEILNIRFGKEVNAGGSVELRDLHGRVLKQLNVEAGDTEIRIDCAHLPAGQYYLRFHIDGKLTAQTVVKT